MMSNKKSSKMKNSPVYGIAWFNENDWEEWKKISPDELENNYDDWLIDAAMCKSKLEKEGFTVVKVTIIPNEFMKWCKKKYKKLNSGSRADYVTEYLLKN